MRKLCPFYRTPLCDRFLLIPYSEYGKRYICFDHLDEVFVVLHFNSSFKILLVFSFVGVVSKYDWDMSWSRMT
jgi:hypothetical protein